MIEQINDRVARQSHKHVFGFSDAQLRPAILADGTRDRSSILRSPLSQRLDLPMAIVVLLFIISILLLVLLPALLPALSTH